MKERKKNPTLIIPVKTWFNELEAVAYTGISLSEIRRFRNEGRIRYGVKKGGKSILYSAQDLDNAIKNNFAFYEAVPLDHTTVMYGTKSKRS
jgi:hypothetical protein